MSKLEKLLIEKYNISESKSKESRSVLIDFFKTPPSRLQMQKYYLSFIYFNVDYCNKMKNFFLIIFILILSGCTMYRESLESASKILDIKYSNTKQVQCKKNVECRSLCAHINYNKKVMKFFMKNQMNNYVTEVNIEIVKPQNGLVGFANIVIEGNR